jgi:hypothetical protein
MMSHPSTARPRAGGDPETLARTRWVPAFAGTSGWGLRCAGVLVAMVYIAGGSPAEATGTVECEAPGSGASLMLTVGSLPVLGVVHMEFTVGDRMWSTAADGDVLISVGQAFRDGERWLIDATDPNVEGVVAEIRLNQAVEGGDMALAGTLRIPGHGAFAVSCIGP